VSQHVRDKVVAPVVAPTTEGNLAQTVVVNAREVPDKVVFSTRSGSGWQDVTATQFADDVNRLAKGLIAAGVEVGDRVGLMSRTRYEWTMTDYAIWTAGAVTVPIYETSSPDQVAWILEDSGAVAVVVETAPSPWLIELPMAAGWPGAGAIPTTICSPSATRLAMFSPSRSAPSSGPPAPVSASAIRAPGSNVTNPGL